MAGKPLEFLARLKRELPELPGIGTPSAERLDFVAAENSMRFHTPQQTVRLLAESIDYSRRGFAEISRIRQ